MENNGKAYADMYTTFEALEDGTFSFKKIGIGDNIQCSIDNGATWVSLMSFETISVEAGNTVMWKSTITPLSSNGIGYFFSTCRFKAYGNTMSLLYGDDFKGKTSLNGNVGVFYGLFRKCHLLTEASNLILPATELTHECYKKMFSGCKSLTTAPELPATELTEGCYYCMFFGCTSLTKAPELPATKASYWCYAFMFYDCQSLTKVPELPATTLDSHCYYCMFYGCRSLTIAPELPATTLAISCYSAMFSGCTSLTTAPELPATTLVDFCYYQMFEACINLNHITMLAANISTISSISTSYYLFNWVEGVSSTGTFVKHPDMNSLPTGSKGIPEGWTVENASV